jgi:hypothetical protein
MHPELRAALLMGVEHLTFDALLEVCHYVKAGLLLDANFIKDWEKSVSQEKALDKPRTPRN